MLVSPSDHPDVFSQINKQEPPRPASPEPTIVVYENNESAAQEQSDVHLSWSSISVRLVGSHPLWGHYLSVVLNLSE
jgi:hypothetical protein